MKALCDSCSEKKLVVFEHFFFLFLFRMRNFRLNKETERKNLGILILK